MENEQLKIHPYGISSNSQFELRILQMIPFLFKKKQETSGLGESS